MKFAILSDIHGNIWALNKCIEYIKEKNINTLIFAGDNITDFPRSHEIIETLRKLQEECECYIVKGNREQYIIDYLKSENKEWSYDHRMGGIYCSLQELTEEDINYIKLLPKSMEITLDNMNIFITHMKNDMPENSKDYDCIINGHTHIPEMYNNRGKIYINPGSVAFGIDKMFNTQFAIYDSDNEINKIQFVNLKYDTDLVLKAIDESNLSKTMIKWDIILKKSILDGVEYPPKYIKYVFDRAKEYGIENYNEIPIDLWNEGRRVILNI